MGRVDIQSLPPAADGDSGHAEQAAARDAGSDMALLNAAVEIPDIDLIDVTSGATVNLRSVADGDNPLLFWFWAPH